LTMNSDERPASGKSGSPEEINENDNKSTISTEGLSTINNQPSTKEMEVHHHPQLAHKPKPWKEYFFEYLMIVLAVTTGFFAESLREYLSDKAKEKEYMILLEKDLAADSANISAWIAGFHSRINEYDTLTNMLKQPGTVSDGAEMYYLARVTTRGTVFDDNNNAMIQLNSSGNFRLISRKNVADRIIDYEKDIDNYKNLNTYDAYEARALYAPQAKVFDAFVFTDMSRPIQDSVINNGPVNGYRTLLGKPTGNPKLLSTDKEKINEVVYFLHQRRSTFAAEILILYKQKHDAADLIGLIHKEYQLENE